MILKGKQHWQAIADHCAWLEQQITEADTDNCPLSSFIKETTGAQRQRLLQARYPNSYISRKHKPIP